MFELTIKDKAYQFRFGMGFVREIDKTKQQKAENGVTQNVGLQYAVAALIDEDPMELVNILEIANKTEKDRVSRQLLDEYLEDENTDIDEIFKGVLDFFKKGNCTKKKTAAVLKLVEEEKAKAAANQTK
jgi:hypothetical protein